MEITVNITADDWKAYVRYLVASSVRHTKPKWLVTIVVSVVFITLFYLYTKFFGQIHWPSFGLAGTSCLIAFAEYRYTAALRAKRLAPSNGGILEGRWKYLISTSGLEIESEIFRSSITWQGIREVIETPELIAFCYDNTGAYLLPKRDLADPVGVLKYVQSIRAKA